MSSHKVEVLPHSAPEMTLHWLVDTRLRKSFKPAHFFTICFTIPHICHLFYTTAIWGLEILHLKVRKFPTKIASRQKSKQRKLPFKNSNDELCENYDMHCESNYTLCKISRWVKPYTICKIANSVKNYTQSSFFHVPCGKFYTWLKTLTQPAVVMVVINMRCVCLSRKDLGAKKIFYLLVDPYIIRFIKCNFRCC